MKRFPVMLALVATAALAAHHLLRQKGVDFAALRRRMMERMIKAMPEDSPPKLVMSVLPRLREQNEEILVLLKAQNDLLRQRSLKS